MSTISAGTTLTTALVQTGDTTGELIIKTNNGNTTAVTFSTAGNLNIPTAGARITGDFSNATLANRLAFQTSTTNGNSTPILLPNGTSTVSGLISFNNSDPTNASFGAVLAVGNTVQISSGITGSGSYLPMTFYTGGSERMRVDTSGNVGIGSTSISTPNRLDVVATGTDGRIACRTASTSGNSTVEAQVNNYWTGPTYTGTAIQQYDSAATGTTCGISNASLGTLRFQNVSAGLVYTNGGTPLVFGTVATERIRITASGGVSFGSSGTAYGSSGQVLTSNGDAPPSWQTAGGIGVGQTWTDVGGSRSSGTTYTNSTGKPIQIMVCTDNTGNTNYGSGGAAKFYINGSNVGQSFCSNAANVGGLFQAIIPVSATYQVSASTIRSWWELR